MKTECASTCRPGYEHMIDYDGCVITWPTREKWGATPRRRRLRMGGLGAARRWPRLARPPGHLDRGDRLGREPTDHQAVPADEHLWVEEYGATPATGLAARHSSLLSRPRAACLRVQAHLSPGNGWPKRQYRASNPDGILYRGLRSEHHIGQVTAGINHSWDFRDQIQARSGGDCPTRAHGKPDG